MAWDRVHTCHAECPCQTGDEPLPDFVSDDGPWCAACGFGPEVHQAFQGHCPVVRYIPARDFRGP